MKLKLITAALFVGSMLYAGVRSVEPHAQELTERNAQQADSSYAIVYPTFFENEVTLEGLSKVGSTVRLEVFDSRGLLLETLVFDGGLRRDGQVLDLSSVLAKSLVVRVFEDQELLLKQRIFKK